MMPLSVAEKLLRLAGGEQLPASAFNKHAIVDELISEGIISERISGRTRKTLFIADTAAFAAWLYNRHSIDDLGNYVRVLKDDMANRADLVQVSNDSKTKNTRTYKGFLVNSYSSIAASLNGQPFTVDPPPGSFQFIYDFESFIPAADVVIVGVENVENFRRAAAQAYLFEDIKPLFVCRYPQEQGRDLIKWLQSIPNPYLHFGDFDFAGIRIYLAEYRKHLGERASFFISHNIEALLAKYGNRKLYDQQQHTDFPGAEENIQHLIALLHKHKMCLEQEALLIL